MTSSFQRDLGSRDGGRRDLGDLLMEERFITEGVLRAARRLAKRERLPMVVVLLEGGHVTEAQVVDILSRRTKLPIVDPQRAILDEDIIREMPYDLAEKHRALPLSLEREARSAAVLDREARGAAVLDREARGAAAPDREPARKGAPARLRVALADPLDREAIGEIEALTGHQVEPLIAPAAALLSAIRFHYRGAVTRGAAASELPPPVQRPSLSSAAAGAAEAPERTTLPTLSGDALKAVRRTAVPGSPASPGQAQGPWGEDAAEGKPGDHITQPLQPEADDAPVEVRLRALVNVLCETGILSERVYQEAVQRLLRGS